MVHKIGSGIERLSNFWVNPSLVLVSVILRDSFSSFPKFAVLVGETWWKLMTTKLSQVCLNLGGLNIWTPKIPWFIVISPIFSAIELAILGHAPNFDTNPSPAMPMLSLTASGLVSSHWIWWQFSNPPGAKPSSMGDLQDPKMEVR